MVRVHPDPPTLSAVVAGAGIPGVVQGIQGTGGLAQLGEHLLCKQGVVGSIPSSSTSHPPVIIAQDLEHRASGKSPGFVHWCLRQSWRHESAGCPVL